MAALQGYVFWGLLVVLTINSLALESVATNFSSSFNRTSFPPGFVFGTASSAYQFEGAWKEGGKGPSIYDVFTHKYPDKFANRSNGDVALDFYHRYKEDVQLMKFMGMDGFRFSISWTRLLPSLKPFVTIFHWDLPQALEDEYLGFLSPRIVDDFADFAELCFKEFGDRVKHWITMNEPWTFIDNGYNTGALAPGRCSAWMNNDCTGGDSATEPYIVAHHMLLSHGATVKIYKEKYQASQKGQIGITLVTYWFLPYSNSKANVIAAQRALDFMYGWFIDPLVYGKYPEIMRQIVGKRLPEFTPEQAKLVKGSYDFIGLNYYTGNYAANEPSSNSVNVSYSSDSMTNQTTEHNGVPIGNPTGVSIFYIFPKGLTDLLIYTKEKYNDPVIYITECGMGDYNNQTTKVGVQDYLRIYFYRRHLGALLTAIKADVKVKGFFAWAFLDNFEWGSGYTLRFGLGYIDYHDNLKRYPKRSAFWFRKFNLK
ncbi:hypothetical protein RHMOL_Rhmol07G0061400 [Rhododendron molle]|uniref:Uncharacterized protein n=1 Tax=Rhododendron molle TaxID=49168 RepID=A0ACC0MYT3_RHOML|nr:hypothetical protein RHMOL_Rhmol07G0061400 [Rhododendron molle]